MVYTHAVWYAGLTSLHAVYSQGFLDDSAALVAPSHPIYPNQLFNVEIYVANALASSVQVTVGQSSAVLSDIAFDQDTWNCIGMLNAVCVCVCVCCVCDELSFSLSLPHSLSLSLSLSLPPSLPPSLLDAEWDSGVVDLNYMCTSNTDTQKVSTKQ